MVNTVKSSPINTTTSTTSASKNKMQLKTEDFIKMMITQLQQQDPMEPAKNDQLLAQMSQISQLQSSTTLNDSLKGMVQQNQIGAAAGLIGKKITGLDDSNNTITGTVKSVSVADDGASLQLDDGTSLKMTRVTTIAPVVATATAAA